MGLFWYSHIPLYFETHIVIYLIYIYITYIMYTYLWHMVSESRVTQNPLAISFLMKFATGGISPLDRPTG